MLAGRQLQFLWCFQVQLFAPPDTDVVRQHKSQLTLVLCGRFGVSPAQHSHD